MALSSDAVWWMDEIHPPDYKPISYGLPAAAALPESSLRDVNSQSFFYGLPSGGHPPGRRYATLKLGYFFSIAHMASAELPGGAIHRGASSATFPTPVLGR
jgi:hypothetical protein